MLLTEKSKSTFNLVTQFETLKIKMLMVIVKKHEKCIVFIDRVLPFSPTYETMWKRRVPTIFFSNTSMVVRNCKKVKSQA